MVERELLPFTREITTRVFVLPVVSSPTAICIMLPGVGWSNFGTSCRATPMMRCSQRKYLPSRSGVSCGNPYLTHEKAIREAREEECFSKKDEKLWDLANSRGNTTYVITRCQQLQKQQLCSFAHGDSLKLAENSYITVSKLAACIWNKASEDMS